MCAFLNIYDYPFKWIKYLVVVTGVYTFVHWIITVPLLYTYFYDCCNGKWSKNWIIWFLTGCFVVWLLALLLIFLIWCCLRILKTRRVNESTNVRLTVKKDDKGDKTESVTVESLTDGETAKKSKTPDTEILSLPEMDSERDFAVLHVNDVQIGQSPPDTVSNFPIPVDETRHYVQKEITGNDDDTKPETSTSPPPKTPREIFFKDLIEAAANTSPDSLTSSRSSYFDFDPKKIAEDLTKKYDLDKFRKRKSGSELSNGQNIPRNTFLLADNKENETLTSEVFVALDGRGVVVDEPVILGRFQVLKE